MAQQPKKWKMAVLIWIAIYPTITLIMIFFGDHLKKIKSLPLQTFATTIIVVPLMVYAIVPGLHKLLHKWLSN